VESHRLYKTSLKVEYQIVKLALALMKFRI